jgi:plasmid stabilization system protein ParE
MRVIIREPAYDDLDRIYAWIAKDRPRAADAVIDRILESAGRLGRFRRVASALIVEKSGRKFEGAASYLSALSWHVL